MSEEKGEEKRQEKSEEEIEQDRSSTWLDLSKRFHTLANVIVGFSSVQALAFVYSFYGAKDRKDLLVHDVATFRAAVLFICVFAAFYAVAVLFCGTQEIHFLEKADSKVGADARPRLLWLNGGRVLTIAVFWLIELLQCYDGLHRT
jgi:uncharacterized membrane protein YbhN (UPF0104 family)